MGEIVNLSRRGVLKGTLAGGVVLGLQIGGAGTALAASVLSSANGTKAAFAPNVYVSVAPSGEIILVVHRSEMGTGIRTSLAMILADELDADWNTVKVVQAQGDAKYGDQNTDGSRSIRQFFQPLREAGGTARQMLVAAAAVQWRVAPATCHTEPGHVVHAASGRRVAYGALATAAARQPVPGRDTLHLKDEGTWRYIGKSLPIVDLDDIVHGRATYGIDVVLPRMTYASIERSPVYGATLKSVDSTDTMKVPGVLHVVRIPAAPLPAGFQPLGGIAVVATSTWAAMQGRRKLRLDWDLGPNASYDSQAYRKALEDTARQPGKIVRNNGDTAAALKSAAHHVSADYYVPHLAHAAMEPLAATASYANGAVEVWTATQNPQQARTTVAQVLGVQEPAVTINVTLLGGGFGRKSKPDYVAEAAFLSREVGAPVKLTWTREDDVHNDYFHAVCAQHMEGGLDAQGKTVAWLHRTVFPSISSTFKADVRYGAAGELGQGVTDMPYDIANVRCENGAASAHTRIGWYRSVYNIPHGFALGSFVDELAAAARQDPVQHLLTLLGTPRHVDLHALGVDYPNYGASIDEYPIDTARYAAVVRAVAVRSGWSTALQARHGRGIAVHRSFLSYVAAVAHVQVADDGSVRVTRVDLAVDCGRIVNPDRVVAQFEGAVVMALGNTLYSELTFRNGASEQSNFTDYQVARIDSVPETHVYIVPSDAPPGGVGEPGVPPTSAAICNAIFNATGQRIRALPVDTSLLKRT
ncbi:xanthine dehydrogenase family protein molybdopterin-binding subunit [Paraburkholderia sp. UCT2]|uniref:xanthine dehydrogenase family protein molybdopterin-binding subunit n=1 Tax=Paraburkholderia sp. UCT2 TaxID=2615208 RepID=UPI001654E694|nr:molybdopterin cofactor-binding domain-containing protein [Paraburkholderia sp. UCT2]MBC8728790.1 xanthine dehydrogenase family protein molybdopterin-binding subunit [Paraburkholderia sp. UCT2]